MRSIDFRTPRFDLDSLYGARARDQPYLYDGGRAPPDARRARLDGSARRRPDLPRDQRPRPDRRSAQRREPDRLAAAVTFIKFHNAVVDQSRSEDPKLGKDDCSSSRSRPCAGTTSGSSIHDFLAAPRRRRGRRRASSSRRDYAAPPGAPSDEPSTCDLHFYHWQEQPFMPVEFSVAAYRFGHSMVRPELPDQRRDQAPGLRRVPYPALCANRPSRRG